MPSAGESYNPWRIFVGCIIPNAIARSTELSSTAKLVFGKLCQYAGENGKAYPSYSSLAKEVGVKQRQAIRAVKELVIFGLIRPVKQNRPDGGSTSNIYEFIWHDIFITGMLTTPGVKHDTGGSVRKVTPAQCHLRHSGVSEMTPKENQTRESNSEMTTTEEIRLLLSGTPLSKISEKELRVLIKRHRSERVIQAADFAAEKWRRERNAIENPGGYLQTLCKDLVVPEWYEPPEVRNAKSEESLERKRSKARMMEEQIVEEERQAQERDDYWLSLSDEEQQKYRDKARESSPLFIDLNGSPLIAIAKLIAWDNCRQMNTIPSNTA